jgi:hypothetical protein
MIRADKHVPPNPAHVAGNAKGEEMVQRKGREPGRDDQNKQGYRSARDATSVGAEHHGPILPIMPEMPPA